MPLTPLARAATFVFLVATMLGVGLKVTGRDIVRSLGDRRLLLKSLVANLVIVPLLGLGIVALLRPPQDMTVGILLLAVAPGGLAAIQFTSKVRESISFAAGLLFLLTVAAVVVSPFLAQVVLPVHTPVSVPYGRVILAVLLLVLLPILVGFALQRVAPILGHVLNRPVTLLGSLAFVTTIVLTMAAKREATRAIGGATLVAMLVLIFTSMLAGWLLGGPDAGTRRVLATGTSMRNAALCLLIAFNSFPDTNVDVAVVAFSALMVPPNMLYTLYGLLRVKWAHKKGESP